MLLWLLIFMKKCRIVSVPVKKVYATSSFLPSDIYMSKLTAGLKAMPIDYSLWVYDISISSRSYALLDNRKIKVAMLIYNTKFAIQKFELKASLLTAVYKKRTTNKCSYDASGSKNEKRYRHGYGSQRKMQIKRQSLSLQLPHLLPFRKGKTAKETRLKFFIEVSY